MCRYTCISMRSCSMYYVRLDVLMFALLPRMYQRMWVCIYMCICMRSCSMYYVRIDALMFALLLRMCKRIYICIYAYIYAQVWGLEFYILSATWCFNVCFATAYVLTYLHMYLCIYYTETSVTRCEYIFTSCMCACMYASKTNRPAGPWAIAACSLLSHSLNACVHVCMHHTQTDLRWHEPLPHAHS